MFLRLGPVKGRRDGRNQLGNLLEFGKEVILSVANLINRVTRGTFGLGGALRLLAKVLFDHDFSCFEIVPLDSLIDAPKVKGEKGHKTYA